MQHPAPQRQDESGFLGHRDELGGRHQAALWVVPAHQCLHPHKAAVLVHLGLEMQQELLERQRMAQVVFQGGTGAHRRLHFRVEEAQRVAPGRFGLVHGQIGLLEQFQHAGLRPQEGHDADAGRAAVVVACQGVGLAELGQDLLAHATGLHHQRLRVRAQAFEHDHELVAAQARHGIHAAHAGVQALRHLLQQQVALVVPQGVVEGLEVVQVNEQQRPALVLAYGVAKGMLHAVQQQHAVGQAGEGVVERQALDLAVLGLALADVGVDLQDGFGPSLVVQHQGPAPLGLDGVSIPVAHADLARPFATGQHRGGGVFEGGGVTVHQGIGLASLGLCGTPAVQALCSLVPVDDAVLQVTLDDGILRLVQQRGLVPHPHIGGLAFDFGACAGGKNLQRGGHEIGVGQRLAKQHKNHACGLSRGVHQLLPGVALGLHLLHDGCLGVALRQPALHHVLLLQQQLHAGCAFQRVFHAVGQLAIHHQRQGQHPGRIARLPAWNQAGHACHLGAQGLAHVARQLHKELSPGGGRDGSGHLEHRGLQLLLFPACAQAHDAKGQVVGQLLHQGLFFGADEQHFRGVQVQQAKRVPRRAQGQCHHPVEALTHHAIGPVGLQRGAGHVAYDDAVAAAHGQAGRTLAARMVLRPGRVQLLQVVAALARVGNDLDGALCIVLCKSHPTQAIAPHLHHHAAHVLQQRGFGGGTHQGLVATAEHALGACQAAELALGLLALGHVGGHDLARRLAVEDDAARRDLHLAHRAVLAAVPVQQAVMRLVVGVVSHFGAALRALLGQPQIGHAHAQQFLRAVTVLRLHGLVDGQKAQAGVVGAHPHGLGVHVEQELVLLLGFAQLRRHLAQAQHGPQALGQDLQMRQVPGAEAVCAAGGGLERAHHGVVAHQRCRQHRPHLLAQGVIP